MIFVTVGTQLPFPRLIDAMNALAPDLGEEVVAQTGPEPGDWPHLTQHQKLTPEAFEGLFRDARVIVGHAGIGTILSAKRYGKPLIVLPRRHALGEHRNDHQLATARQVEKLDGVTVAWEAEALGDLLRRPGLPAASDSPSPSHAALIAYLRDAIDA